MQSSDVKPHTVEGDTYGKVILCSAPLGPLSLLQKPIHNVRLVQTTVVPADPPRVLHSHPPLS